MNSEHRAVRLQARKILFSRCVTRLTLLYSFRQIFGFPSRPDTRHPWCFIEVSFSASRRAALTHHGSCSVVGRGGSLIRESQSATRSRPSFNRKGSPEALRQHRHEAEPG